MASNRNSPQKKISWSKSMKEVTNFHDYNCNIIPTGLLDPLLIEQFVEDIIESAEAAVQLCTSISILEDEKFQCTSEEDVEPENNITETDAQLSASISTCDIEKSQCKSEKDAETESNKAEHTAEESKCVPENTELNGNAKKADIELSTSTSICEVEKSQCLSEADLEAASNTTKEDVEPACDIRTRSDIIYEKYFLNIEEKDFFTNLEWYDKEYTFKEKLDAIFEDASKLESAQTSCLYIYLDSTVCSDLTNDNWENFVKSIIFTGIEQTPIFSYIRKAEKVFFGGRNTDDTLQKKMCKIWENDGAVISLKISEFMTQTEVNTRKALLIDALGKEQLSLKRRGSYYGLKSEITPGQKCMLAATMMAEALNDDHIISNVLYAYPDRREILIRKTPKSNILQTNSAYQRILRSSINYKELFSNIDDFFTNLDWYYEKQENYEKLLKTIFQDFTVMETSQTHFIYLLLDSRACSDIMNATWDIIKNAIFYVGRGQNGRNTDHAGESKKVWVSKCKNDRSRINKINEIWESDRAVIELKIAENLIYEDVCTREALLINLIGKIQLCNINDGQYFGVPWELDVKSRRELGAAMLAKAMIDESIKSRAIYVYIKGTEIVRRRDKLIEAIK